MLFELVTIHNEVMSTTPSLAFKRFLHDQINWDAKAICIQGARGVGKTTLMCQLFLEKYKNVEQALYFSADNINVTSKGLFKIAQEFFSAGGLALFIDEIHKYPNWSIELKNIIDTYRKRQIIFSGSSSLDLQHSKGDLSRRVVYHSLPCLSFREYLKLSQQIDFPAVSLEDIIKNHLSIAEKLKSITILKHFNNYLNHGSYPFFSEGIEDYLSKINNVIEKIIFEDIAVVYNLKQTTLPVIKRLLWLVATTNGLTPNVDSISKNFRVSRDVIYNCFEYLHKSGLIKNLYTDARGMKLARKPGKVYLDNTNLLHAINGSLKLNSDIGVVRETFFVNQLELNHRVNLHDSGDFIIDDYYVIEVGGKGKTEKQIKSVKNSYLAIDGIEMGFGKRIPLYLFGLLY